MRNIDEINKKLREHMKIFRESGYIASYSKGVYEALQWVLEETREL